MAYPEFDSCLLCGSKRISDLKGYEEHFLAICSNCRFVFCKRIASAEELATYYNSYPIDAALSPITRKRYEALCLRLDRYRKTNNILDVGCGDGHFLEVAKERGWNVFGTEFTDRAVQVCSSKGIEMFKGQLADMPLRPGFFDVVTSFEVLEHINNPRQEIPIIYQLLRKEGMHYVTTPNFNSISRAFLGAKWNMIGYPEHLSYYTPGTIKRLFRDHHFDKISISSTGISLDRLFRSGASDEKPTPTKVDELVRQKMERNFFLQSVKNGVNFLLDLSNKGDSLKASFIKK